MNIFSKLFGKKEETPVFVEKTQAQKDIEYNAKREQALKVMKGVELEIELERLDTVYAKFERTADDLIPAKWEHNLIGESYVDIESYVNEENSLSFEFKLDYNYIFVQKLIEEGYIGDSMEEVIESWFKRVCAIIAEEMDVSVVKNVNSIQGS